MNNLGCFKDREKLIAELLSTKHNTEKMVDACFYLRKLISKSYNIDKGAVTHTQMFRKVFSYFTLKSIGYCALFQILILG